MKRQFLRRIEVVSLKREKNLTLSPSIEFKSQQEWEARKTKRRIFERMCEVANTGNDSFICRVGLRVFPGIRHLYFCFYASVFSQKIQQMTSAQ